MAFERASLWHAPRVSDHIVTIVHPAWAGWPDSIVSATRPRNRTGTAPAFVETAFIHPMLGKLCNP